MKNLHPLIIYIAQRAERSIIKTSLEIKMFDVVTIGSAVLDVFLKSSQFHLVSTNGNLSLCEAFNEKIDVDDAVISSGGGGTNTAVGLSRLGLKTACISEVGNDFAAKVIEQDLKE